MGKVLNWVIRVVTIALMVLGCGDKNRNVSNPTFTNPVMQGELRMGDPFVLLTGEYYYLYGTNAAGQGFKSWRSEDLIHWENLGWVYRKNDRDTLRSSFWAPEVHYYPPHDKFYLIYSSKVKKEGGLDLCLASAPSPEGPFVDEAVPWLPKDGWQRIDGHLFLDQGTPYLFFAKVGVVGAPWENPSTGYLYGRIFVVMLSEDLREMVSEPELCLEAEQPWENPQSMKSRCNEGSYVFRDGETYYMTYSANHYADPSYGIGLATAASPLGPWMKSENNPILSSDTTIGFSGPGHNSFTFSPDGSERYMVYHAHTDWKHPSGDRQVYLDRVVIREGMLHVMGPTLVPQPEPK